MANRKTKILLDADVIIHFSKGECLSKLPEILPEYEFAVLDKVYNEILSVQKQLDMQIHFLNNITLIDFSTVSQEVKREYALLTDFFGSGESACMAYCRYYQDVVGSNNTKDDTDYCEKHDIVYLTTHDFLYLAYKRGKMTAKECTDFMKLVTAKGSRGCPVIDITKYTFKKNI